MQVIDGEAEISYPRKWQYRIIGKAKLEIEEAVFELCNKPYDLKPSKVSRKGNYHSFVLEIEVKSREEMTMLFQNLKGHAAIQMVI